GSGARRYLLHSPAVTVGIAEENERAPRVVLNLADLDAPAGKLLPCLVDVGDDNLQPLHGTGHRVHDAGADHYRTRRAGRGELDEPKLVGNLMIVVGVETGHLIKRLRLVHV